MTTLCPMNSLLTDLWMSHARQACSAFNTTMHLIPCLDSISMALGCANYFQMWTIPWTARAHSVLSACMPHLKTIAAGAFIILIVRMIVNKQPNKVECLIWRVMYHTLCSPKVGLLLLPEFETKSTRICASPGKRIRSDINT